jgi:hypothetical protein
LALLVATARVTTDEDGPGRSLVQWLARLAGAAAVTAAVFLAVSGVLDV